MVVPCSRSSVRPSVKSERSRPSPPARAVLRATAANWSSSSPLASSSRRPISVLLPSSTLPAVVNRSVPVVMSEIAFTLAQLHGRIRRLVVHAGGAALRDGGAHGLGDDLVGGVGLGSHRARAGDVAHGAEADVARHDGLAIAGRRELGHRDQQAVALHDLARVRVVDRGNREAFAGDVLPDVQLGPVGEREGADVLAAGEARVVEAPELRALVARIPLAEVVAMRKDALLRARLLLV